MNPRKRRFDENDLVARYVLTVDDGDDGDQGGDTGTGSDNEPDNDGNQSTADKDEPGKGSKDKDGDSGKDTKPSNEEARLLKELMKQKDKVKDLTSNFDKTDKELKALKEILGDLDPDKVKELVDANKDAQRKRLEEEGKYKEIVQQMKDEHQKGVAALNETIKTLTEERDAIKSQVEELSIGRAFSDSTFIRENSALPPSIVRKEFAVYFDIENGQLVPYTKPRGEQGRAPLVDAEGNSKSFEEAIAHLFTTHPDSKSLLKAKAKPGAGSGTDKGTGTKPSGDGSKEPEVKGVDRIAKALSGSKK